MRALLITTPTRYKEMPDIPTAAELGIPELGQIIGRSGIYAPKGTPKPVIDKLVEALKELEGNPGWRGATEKMGWIPYIQGPERAAEFAKTQYETYLNLGKALDIIDKIQ